MLVMVVMIDVCMYWTQWGCIFFLWYSFGVHKTEKFSYLHWWRKILVAVDEVLLQSVERKLLCRLIHFCPKTKIIEILGKNSGVPKSRPSAMHTKISNIFYFSLWERVIPGPFNPNNRPRGHCQTEIGLPWTLSIRPKNRKSFISPLS